MVDISTEGLKAAPLNKNQLDSLLQAEKNLNRDMEKGEIYLLAVTRMD